MTQNIRTQKDLADRLDAHTPCVSPLNVPLTPLRFLERSAAIHPAQTACVDGPRRFTFAEFAADTQALARALKASGLRPGDRVGVLSPNSYEALLAQFAVPLAAGVVVAINVRLAPAEISYIADHAGIDIIMATAELIDKVKAEFSADIQFLEIPQEDGTSSGHYGSVRDFLNPHRSGQPLPYTTADENLPIALNYTSGTTGKPKGVIYTHRGAYLNALGEVHAQQFTAETVYLWTLPMFHCSGWCTGWAAMAVSATQVALRAVRGEEMWRLITKEGVTHLCGAPAVLTALVDSDDKRRVTGLRVVTAGAPPSPTIITRCENLGVEVTHVYGLTETYGPYTVCEPQPGWADMTVRRRAILKARQGVAMLTNEQVRVVKNSADAAETLDDVPADGKTMGEIVVRGNGVMAGYYRDEDATSEAFRGGYFHTGDLGVMHPDGYIQLLDRAKDVIVSGGENISTIEVEQAVVSYPDVSDCAVIGVPDDKWGERPRAYVVLRPEAYQGAHAEESSTGADGGTHDAGGSAHERDVAEAIIAHCRAHVAGYKVPKDIVVLRDLPRTSTGKVKKNELREAAWEGQEQRIN
ncbi:AMP-binding protein [Corynebacterium heidelbergense]|uniref:Acyl-CoA synthetase n=1 Tax=Corynebacterium heidelbergense TaxID=2055947 RepID=A0A364V5R9_9CORY|nr:AMP-binding protein [Corynebacterium heidelbergense]RAV32000.1 acyl-CoA synthetase [Corynebacterium heidelbergense]